ncbi:hypothetical protein BDV18DRAFT_139879 [Aspergillus unguis]
MSTPRKITSFFKRPDFATPPQNNRPESPAKNHPATPSSPLTELSQLLPLDGTTPDTPGGPSAQLKRSLIRTTETSVETIDNDPAPDSSFQSTGPTTSQRVIKKGREVVISSDGDESDSVGSIESSEDILAMFLTPGSKSQPVEEKKTMTLPEQKSPKKKGVPAWKVKPKKYKNSLSALVTQAVDDYETESGINKLKAQIEAESALRDDAEQVNGSNIHEGTLASAINDGADDSVGLQRLLDAVRRTEAFDLGKSWSFFDLQAPLPPAPDFPRDCVCSGTYLATLREPDSRERAFYSGIIDFAISRDLLPDELIKWIFHSIPSETRDNLRNAYCRTLKRLSAERMEILIRPDDIDTLFWQMGARPEALVRSDLIVPDANPSTKPLEPEPQHHTALISVLGFFREAASLLADDTRNHILSIILRLSLDPSLTCNTTLCSEIERTIPVVLDAVPDETADRLANQICQIAYTTLKDTELQSRLLEHIVPVNEYIATLRRRLAYIFLTDDPAADVGSQDGKSEINRITNILKDPRFDVKRYKRKDQPDYDYGQLIAITTMLNIIIESGWSETQFPDKVHEKIFNSEVDLLAERVKKIFSAIEDSGASHLKRTVAKEAMECLHYRIVYSVRTMPPVKKSVFGEHEQRDKTQNTLYQHFDKEKKEKKVAFSSDKPES